MAESSSRFNYWYAQERTGGDDPRDPPHLGTLADVVHVIFNTNYEDQGQVGARMMRELLR